MLGFEIDARRERWKRIVWPICPPPQYVDVLVFIGISSFRSDHQTLEQFTSVRLNAASVLVASRPVGRYRRSRLADREAELRAWIQAEADLTLVQLCARLADHGVAIKPSALWLARSV